MMLAARGAFLAARRKPKLPYDAEVEYLESTGTQWIDTGYCPVSTDRITLTGEIQNLPSNNGVTYAICGCRNSPTDAYVGGQVYDGIIYGTFHNGIRLSNLDRYRASGTVYKTAFTLTLGNDERRVDINRKTYASYLTSESFVATKSIWLFAFNGTDWQSLNYRLHSFEVEGKVSMIPVRFTNEQGVSEGAMYDRANPTVGINPDGSPRTDGLYRNRGRGAFLYGSDKTA